MENPFTALDDRQIGFNPADTDLMVILSKTYDILEAEDQGREDRHPILRSLLAVVAYHDALINLRKIDSIAGYLKPTEGWAPVDYCILEQLQILGGFWQALGYPIDKGSAEDEMARIQKGIDRGYFQEVPND